MRKSIAAAGSALFFVVVPGTVAGLIPWLLTGWDMRRPSAFRAPVLAVGAILLLAGLTFLTHAFVRFVIEGFGTPAPIAPPMRLVVGGPYRYVRNPMYVAVVAIIIGQALILAQPVLLVYALVAWLIVAGFVRWYEEPTLARRFGADYDAYRHAVPAWWPRLRPWKPHRPAE
jgi:protein-S-isoprenylcysteine O-methyltransferase Ste14